MVKVPRCTDWDAVIDVHVKGSVVPDGQNRPLHGLRDSSSRTPTSVVERAFPALPPHVYPLFRSQYIFSWDPV